MEHVSEAAGRRPLRVSVSELVQMAEAMGEASKEAMFAGFVKELGKKEDWTQQQKVQVLEVLETRKLIVLDSFLCGIETAFRLMLAGPAEAGVEIKLNEDFDHEDRLKALLAGLESQGLVNLKPEPIIHEITLNTRSETY